MGLMAPPSARSHRHCIDRWLALEQGLGPPSPDSKQKKEVCRRRAQRHLKNIQKKNLFTTGYNNSLVTYPKIKRRNYSDPKYEF